MVDDEPDDEQQDEPSEDDEGGELTPEQREQLLKSLRDLQLSLIPKIDLSPRNLPQIDVLKPVRDSQAAWRRQLLRNSDIFKIAELHQTNLSRIASQLTRTIDFGLGDTISSYASQFAAQQASLLKIIQPSLAYITTAAYPPNLQDIEDLEFEEVEQVVMVDGIALYGVPRPSTAEALIRADSASERRAILGKRWKTISADCREAVTACSAADIADYVPFAVAALDALDAGHRKAAQALAGSLIDAIISASFTKADRYKLTPNAKTRTNAAYKKFPVRRFIAFAPLWQAYQQFRVENGDAVPKTFNRHATVHTVDSRQFSLRNAVQALMFACGLLCRLDDEATVRSAA